MKKIIFVTLAVASSLLAVSCDAESVTDANLHTKKINAAVGKTEIREQNSTHQNNNATMGDVEGPDDQLFPLTPPKKK